MTPVDHLDVLERASRRFHQVLARCAADVPVPSCPDWSAADLLDHLTDVQRFFTTIVVSDVRTDAAAEAVERARRPRPATHADQLAAFAAQADALHRALAGHPPDAPRWMWTADPALHAVGYLRRRMAHEALVHRVDAELTAGAPRDPVAPEVAADGLDEVLRIFYGSPPGWATATPRPGAVVRLSGTDVDREWHVQAAVVSGTRPGSGQRVEAGGLVVLDHPPADAAVAATLRGPAFDLDLWWWNRPAAVQVSGEPAVLARLEEIRAEGIGE